MQFQLRMRVKYSFLACIVFYCFAFPVIPLFHLEKINIRIKSKPVVYDLFTLYYELFYFSFAVVEILSYTLGLFQMEDKKAPQHGTVEYTLKKRENILTEFNAYPWIHGDRTYVHMYVCIFE